MDFKDWFLSLPDEQRERFASEAGTTAGYIRVHLIGRRKIPRPELLRSLAQASRGKFTVARLLAFFYDTSEPKLPGDAPEQSAASQGVAGAHSRRPIT